MTSAINSTLYFFSKRISIINKTLDICSKRTWNAVFCIKILLTIKSIKTDEVDKSYLRGGSKSWYAKGKLRLN